MKDWFKSKFFETLAGKLTAILAFAILLIAVLALLGPRIEDRWLPLVYFVAIAAMAIFTYEIFVQNKPTQKEPNAGKSQFVSEDGPDKTKKEKPTVDSLSARANYLNAVIADSRAIRLVGLDPQAADPSRGGLTLESLYVSLDTTTIIEETVNPRPGAKRRSKKNDDEDEVSSFDFGDMARRPIGALEALFDSENHRMVLLGLPGTGKSTFVRYLALRMAQAETDKSKNIKDLLPGWKSGTVLPLILSLGRMAETIPADCKKGSAVLIESYIRHSLSTDERTADFADMILGEVNREGGLVLFDGLDEVADLNLRPIVVQAVEDFAQKYGRQSSSRFLVTCRTYSYYHDAKWQLTGWATHELALLDNEKIEYFVNAWHDEHIRIEPSRRADLELKRGKLLNSIQPDDRRRLHEIAPFPIILTMMAVVHTHYGDLPDTRAEVYERCVDLLLIRWELERPVAGVQQKTQKRTIIDELGISSRGILDRALWEIAFRAHEGREDDKEKKRGPALVTEDLLTGVLQTHFKDLGKVQTFLDYCQSSNGLLMLQGSVTPADAPEESPPRRVYAFPHLTFEEFLAARHLIRANFGKITADLVHKSDRWREVVMLLGEYLCFVHKDEERMGVLIQALTPDKLPTKADSPFWRALWYAADLLALYKRAFPNETLRVENEIKTDVQKLVFKGALSPRERASAADTLDELGYIVPDLSTFVSVSDFYISKYLTTNGQYERFLKADFGNKKYWLDFPKFDENSQSMQETWGDEAWTWLQKELQDKENNIQAEMLLPRYWRDPRFGIARRNAPVVGISWYEASAYCKWLLENWENLEEGKQGLAKPKLIRLPLETEWSFAAGGEEPEQRHAFGVLKDSKEIAQYANTRESGINRTTPVWMYPQGASPHHIMDMSGNVFEWQANYYRKEHDYLSLRGGSWYLDGENARVSVRYVILPHSRLDDFGFRVALFPSE